MSDEPKNRTPEFQKRYAKMGLGEKLKMGGVLGGIVLLGTAGIIASDAESMKWKDHQSVDSQDREKLANLAMAVALLGLGLSVSSIMGLAAGGNTEAKRFNRQLEEAVADAPTFNDLDPAFRRELRRALDSAVNGFVLVDKATQKPFDIGDKKNLARILEAAAVAIQPIIAVLPEQSQRSR